MSARAAVAGAPVWRFGDAVAPLRAALVRGAILALPTESSYGLAVDPRHAGGVEAIYRVKRRAPRAALLVVAADGSALAALGVDVTSVAARRFLALGPAPLTAVLPIARPLPASAGEASLAVRIPADRRLRELLAALGPLTATSANLSGEPPILEPGALHALLAGEDAWIVDGGVLPGGAPSTLVDLRGTPQILRSGAFPAAQTLAWFGVSSASAGENSAPPVENISENA
jgi:tRNA threonylcarbamoyl adenosine modification protein (Sua5/YciO/YrdC/YwlC family)